MNTMTGNIDIDTMIVGKDDKNDDRKGILRIFGSFLVLCLSAFIIYTASQAITQANNDATKSLRSQVNILLQSRADLIDVWLKGLNTEASRITEADLFKLFATEYIEKQNTPEPEIIADETVDNMTPVPSFQNDDITTQTPYLNRILTDYISSVPFTRAIMIDEKKNIILSSEKESNSIVSSKKFALVEQAFESGNTVFSPIREEGSEMIMDVMIPIFAPQTTEKNKNKPVTLFVFTLPVKNKIASFLTITDSGSIPGALRLFQNSGDGNFDEIRLSNTSLVAKSFFRNLVESPKGINFSKGQSIDNTENNVFTMAHSLKQNTWYIAWEVPVDTALSEVRMKEKNIVTVSLLAIFFITTSYIAFWWYSRNRFNKRMANMYKGLAKRIETQKWLLDSINNSVAESIGVKDDNSQYMYVNPAFSRLINQPSEEIIGKTDSEIFGEIVAHRLEYWDKITLKSNEPISSNEELYLGTKKHYLNVSKAPLNNNEIAEKAIVTIISDNTDLVEAQIAHQKATMHTIVALSKTIEMRDPHLSGHSRRMASVARAIAEAMSLSHDDITAIEMAANLSQIGKITIPRTLLTKETRLNEQEIAIIQKHIEHAISILQEVEFDIPVRETLYQMYERLDGDGYPRGLKGDDISVRARILGIADYFCARIEPRSYRSAITPDEAISILESMPDRYDANVVKALKQLISHSEFQSLLTQHK